MRKKNDTNFRAPKKPGIKAWRYMDFTKFVSMLDTSSLYFSRSDLLGDPFEGTYPRARLIFKTLIAYVDGHKLKIPMPNNWDSFYRCLINWTFINCWHTNRYESVAMWKLYAKTNEAIAIQSTTRRLRKCLAGADVETVHYIDYERTFLPENYALAPFLHKRKSFEHERELRAIIQELPIKAGKLQTRKKQHAVGIYVPVDLDRLIEKIYVAPTAPIWFRELIHSVISKYNLQKEVFQSFLDSQPYD